MDLTTSPGPGILLVVPPFQTVARPALGVSQLKANLAEQGFAAEVLYLNLHFADRIGLDLYEWIAENTFSVLLGEFIFSGALFDRSDQEIAGYASEMLADFEPADRLRQLSPERNDSEILRRLMQLASSFCDEAVEKICALQPQLVGLTSSFQQNCCSLAVIKRLKRRRPDLPTVLGGANCQTEMGEELFRLFPEIDYLGQGECDLSFVELLRSLRNGEESPSVPGFLSRADGRLPAEARPLGGEDLDRLPYPDFSDYFSQLETLSEFDRVAPGLMMETSRGCWWGARRQCTFCGLNGEQLGFRSKSPARALEEVSALVNQYRVEDIVMADNILDMKYFKTFLPRLAEHPIAYPFYETKGNLSRQQVRLLARARVGRIQPGIESLSDRALQLMRKGTTRLQNIQLLKWCAEYGIGVGWNYLYGFPGEGEEELAQLAQDLGALHHLQPPSRASCIRMDRFSAYFNDPGSYGLEPVRPARPYDHIYRLPLPSLQRIAYFYQSAFLESVRQGDAFRTLQDIVKRWQEAHPRSYLLAIPRKKGLIIVDTRPCARRLWHRLAGVRRRVYEYCDRARTLSQLLNVAGSITEPELQSMLDGFVRSGLMLHSDGRYLSLAVRWRTSDEKVAHGVLGGYVKSPQQPRRIRHHLLALLRFRMSPRKLVNGLARRILPRTIPRLANLLSDSRADASDAGPRGRE